MLRPLAALGFALGLLASQAALAQSPAPRGDCISDGRVALGAFSAQYVPNERGVDTSVMEYFVGLRATRTVGPVAVTMSPSSGVQGGQMTEGMLQLPVGQEVRVRLGRRSGPRLSDRDLQAALTVICRPA